MNPELAVLAEEGEPAAGSTGQGKDTEPVTEQEVDARWKC